MKRIVCALAAIAIVLALPIRPLAHESPVDHVDRGIRIWISGDTIFLRYQLQLSERAAMMQLSKMDVDADGSISSAERDGYFASLSQSLAGQLHLKIEDKAVDLKPDGGVQLLPQFRQVFTFSSSVGVLGKGRHSGVLMDDFSRKYPGPYRWDPAAESSAGTRVIVSEAPRMQESAGHPGMLVLNFEIVVP